MSNSKAPVWSRRALAAGLCALLALSVAFFLRRVSGRDFGEGRPPDASSPAEGAHSIPGGPKDPGPAGPTVGIPTNPAPASVPTLAKIRELLASEDGESAVRLFLQLARGEERDFPLAASVLSALLESGPRQGGGTLAVFFRDEPAPFGLWAFRHHDQLTLGAYRYLVLALLESLPRLVSPDEIARRVVSERDVYAAAVLSAKVEPTDANLAAVYDAFLAFRDDRFAMKKLAELTAAAPAGSGAQRLRAMASGQLEILRQEALAALVALDPPAKGFLVRVISEGDGELSPPDLCVGDLLVGWGESESFDAEATWTQAFTEEAGDPITVTAHRGSVVRSLTLSRRQSQLLEVVFVAPADR